MQWVYHFKGINKYMCLNFVSLLYGNIKRYNVLQQNLFGVLSDSKSIDGVLKISV